MTECLSCFIWQKQIPMNSRFGVPRSLFHCYLYTEDCLMQIKDKCLISPVVYNFPRLKNTPTLVP